MGCNYFECSTIPVLDDFRDFSIVPGVVETGFFLGQYKNASSGKINSVFPELINQTPDLSSNSDNRLSVVLAFSNKKNVCE
jgi:hypothetical protein